jgi:hypothetical protein
MTCAHSLVPIELMTSDLAMRAFQASQLARSRFEATRRARDTAPRKGTSRSGVSAAALADAEITRHRIRRGIFHNVAEVKAAIDEWIEHRNQDPKPFPLTATGKTILVKHRRAKKVLAKAGRKLMSQNTR